MRLRGTVKDRLAHGLIVASALLASVAGARGSIMRFVPIEGLAREASLVVRARVTGRSVHWTSDHQGIYTRIEAVVVSGIKGRPAEASPGRRLTIVQAGGQIDGVSLDWTGRPIFRVGEDLVLFLQPYDQADPEDPRLIVVGGKQGRMRVVEDAGGKAPLMVQRELAGVLDSPFVEGELPTGPAPRRDLLPFEELLQRVRAAAPGGG